MESEIDVKKMAERAQVASRELGSSTLEVRNQVLEHLIQGLIGAENAVMAANRSDLTRAQDAGLSPAMLERLSLEGKLQGIIDDVKKVRDLPDPLGVKLEETTLPSGLLLGKYSSPLGVLGVIYESRPNVTVDVSALAIKSGNAALLRGGSETLETNRVLGSVIQEALKSSGLCSDAICLIDSIDRSHVLRMIQLDSYIDLIIPRGSAGLQKFCKDKSTIPVVTGGIGICHLFVEASADLSRSLDVIENAKTQRPTVCNSLDTLLVDAKIAKEFIPKVVTRLCQKNVAFQMDSRAFSFVDHPSCKKASERDFDIEWLNLTLGIKVVDGLDEAILHIHQHSTKHSDGILTEDSSLADRFVKLVDSAALYVNASTRFTDGSEFGLGSEVAVSTQKLHARGPMGLRDLTSYKWIAKGSYTVRP